MAAPRIRLIAYDPAWLLALLQSAEAFRGASGLVPAEGLRGFYVSGDVSEAFRESLRGASGADPWCYGFAAQHIEDIDLIGTGGFKGAPDEAGVVEIAYAVVPSREGQGYATEIARALIDFAARDSRTRRIRAHTLPEPNASTRVLKKCGFEFLGEVVDPEDGSVWRWERPAPRSEK